MYNSKKYYDGLNSMSDTIPPNGGNLTIYYITSFLAFMAGLILFADKFEQNNK